MRKRFSFLQKIISVQLFVLMLQPVTGQLRDTNLVSLNSRPFFYNVMKAGVDQIYAGTSEGIFKISEAAFYKVEDRVGYVTIDQQGNLQIDSIGLKYHDEKAYLSLLPFPDKSRPVYHAGTEDYFYLVSGGRLHIYEILPYVIKYPNHSVRTISSHFVGTYSGIYYKGVRLEKTAKFTDGYIREFNGKAFICYSDFIIADLHGGDTLPVIWKEPPPGISYHYTSDILYSDNLNRYFVAMNHQLATIDKELSTARSLYTPKGKHEEVVLLGQDRMDILFASGRDLMKYIPEQDTSVLLTSLPEQIMAGVISPQNIHLITSTGLYVTSRNGRLEKLTDLRKAHSILSLGSAEFAIATDLGLFLYNTTSKQITPLIRGVEFNRRALYLENGLLYAGSINGLYVLEAKNLGRLTNRISSQGENLKISPVIRIILVFLIIFSVILSFLVYRMRNRLKEVNQSKQSEDFVKVTKVEIEAFIRQNLSSASLKSICDRFQTHNTYVYSVLAPEKPGAFINRLRMEQVRLMRSEQKTAKEISEQTGFSESYVRKVWSQPGQ